MSGGAFAEVCGVTARTARKWVALDDPLPRHKEGARYFIDPVAGAAWLEANGKLPELERMQSYLSAIGGPTRQPDNSTLPAHGVMPHPGEKEDERKPRKRSKNIFEVKAALAKLFDETMYDYMNSTGAARLAAQRNVASSGDVLRKFESSCLEVAVAQKLVIKMADVVHVIGNIMAQVKRDMLSLPPAVSADLAAMDEEGPIVALLTDKITDALRHLSGAIRKLGDG